MSDELIMRLRSEEVLPCGGDSVNPVRKPTAREIEAADALEAQARRIAKLLEAIGLLTTLNPNMEVDVNNPVRMAIQIVAHVDARIAKLEAALKPFADCVDLLGDQIDEECIRCMPTAGQVRAARAALEKK